MPDEDFDDLEAAKQLKAQAQDGTKPPGNRAQRRAAPKKTPAKKPAAKAPAKKPASRTEAEGGEIVLTLWDREIRISQEDVLMSWDWQLGGINKMPLQMVKGLLTPGEFEWFCMNSQRDGKNPIEASAEIIEMFTAELGLGESGN